MEQLTIRTAQLNQLQALNSLIYLSKAHWPYIADQLESWQDDLTVSENLITAGRVYVGTIDNNVVAMFTLNPVNQAHRLEHFFVSPNHINQGIGKQMWRYAIQLAKKQGANAVLVDSDPNAEPFYLARGAVRVGVIPAPIEYEDKRIRPQRIYYIT